MSRAGKTKKRETAVDPIYQSRVLAKLINRMMKAGKKQASSDQVYATLDILAAKTAKEPLEVFTTALENIKPITEVRSRRVGGAAYQVPTPVRGDRRESLALRWLITAARARSNKEFHRFSEKLAAELLDALNNQGGAIKKKEDTHKMADANKAFAHFRW